MQLDPNSHPNAVRTVSGKYVNVFDPDPETITIEDIAHALSNLCRWGGHSHKFYSVAEHSVFVYHDVPKKYALQALLHDAAEAYLADIPRPIKMRLLDYKHAEEKLLTVIFNKFGIGPVLADEVKQADAEMLKVEWVELMIHPEQCALSCMEPETARRLFLQTFYLIMATGGGQQ